MRTLGRVGEPLRGLPRGSRRRGRGRRVAAAVVAAVLAGLVWLAVTAQRQVAGDPVAAAVAAVPSRPAADVRASRGAGSRTAGVALADVDGLLLRAPAVDPLAVAFHEASRPQALTLVPVGTPVADDNPARTPAGGRGAVPYAVLQSADRTRPATSAVAVVVAPGAPVVAPVDGRVVAVTEYPLSRQVHDWRIVLEPVARPDLHVVIEHLDDPAVEIGDTVVAAKTPLAAPRRLPFPSAVDAVTGRRSAHTTLEVTAAVDAEPLDPNQPAVPAAGAPTPQP